MNPTEPTKGELFEARVARLLRAEGALVRRRVNLEAQYGGRFRTITDIDVLGFDLSADLELRTTAVECKTTESKSQPGTGDRLLWVVGLRALVKADRAILATSRHAEPRVRELATDLGIETLDERDLLRREHILGLGGEIGFGLHHPQLLALERAVFETSKRDEELKRVYWFVRSELWLSAPPIALKRGLSALRLLGARWSERCQSRNAKPSNGWQPRPSPGSRWPWSVWPAWLTA